MAAAGIQVAPAVVIYVAVAVATLLVIVAIAFGLKRYVFIEMYTYIVYLECQQ